MVMADKVRGVVGVCISLGRRLAFSSSPAARSITASPASAFSKGFPVVVKAVLPLSTKSGMQFLPRLLTYTVSERSNWSFQGISTDAQKATPAVGVVNDETFKELVLDSNIPVLVDFWAPWCGPCHMIAPLIEDLGRQYVGKLKCFKLNIDENPNVASAYAIQSIPTIMIFVGGEKRDAILGAVPKSTLTAVVDKHLGV